MLIILLKIIGLLLVVVGCVISTAGNMRLLVIARRVGFGWFFGCCFCLLVWPLFGLAYFSSAWKPLTYCLAGMLMVGFGLLFFNHG